MSNERSAEWLRGAVESHINTCNLITSITSATKSHPARQGLMAAGNELHNQLDRYRTLLAAAEARASTHPTAAEVIEACRVALEKSSGYVSAFEGLHKCAWGDAGMCKSAKDDLTETEDFMRDALALCARWKEANGGK